MCGIPWVQEMVNSEPALKELLDASEAPRKTIRQPRENRNLKKEFQQEFETQQTLWVD